MAAPRILVSDIGGTNIRFAVAAEGRIDVAGARSYTGKEFPGPAEAALRYFEETGTAPPDAACLALAGPVTSRRINLTNSPWIVDADAFEATTGVGRCELLNDFEALAWSLPILEAEDLAPIGNGVMRDGCRAVLGPGTGLGVGLLAESGSRRIAMAGEGGHISFGPTNEREIEILRHMTRAYGRVSGERLVSGPGMEALHLTLGEIDGAPRPKASAKDIVDAALADRSSAEWDTVSVFCGIFGTIAGDIALVGGAVGGVYLAGGISKRLADVLPETTFRERFEAKGRLAPYVRPIAVNVIVGGYAALNGAAEAMRHALAEHGRV